LLLFDDFAKNHQEKEGQFGVICGFCLRGFD